MYKISRIHLTSKYYKSLNISTLTTNLCKKSIIENKYVPNELCFNSTSILNSFQARL